MYADYHLHCEYSDDSNEPMENQIRQAYPLEGTPVKMVMADTRKVFGTRVLLHKALVQEARETLGEANVVVK